MSANGSNGNGKAKPRTAAKNRGGRPCVLTTEPERVERLLAYLAEHKSKTLAAAKAGLVWQTIKKWLDKGKQEDEGPYREFFLAFMRARERLIDDVCEKAMIQDPKWFLANELRDEFSLKLEVEHSGDVRFTLADAVAELEDAHASRF